jgi:glycosyltransferase involved in cell wall biosynthesis
LKLSIIIPVSRLPEARQCLGSLERQTLPTEAFEVVLVSFKKLQELAASSFPFTLQTVLSEVNHPSRMRNEAVASSRGELLAFLDDDTVVPPHWAEELVSVLSEHPERIVGGPNRDTRKAYRFALANAVQEHPLLEGLKNHAPLGTKEMPTNAHNLPLSNLAMHRDTFLKVGGFNEKANYFMDGSEFLYIASRLGVPLHLDSRLEIQHDNRPMFLPYFKYKWRARKKIGGNFLLLPECYARAFQIKAVLASFALLQAAMVLFMLLGGFLKVLPWAVGVYLAFLYAAGWRTIRRPSVFLLQAPCVFVTQVIMYFGFLWGFLLQGLRLDEKSLRIIEHKASRYASIEERHR